MGEDAGSSGGKPVEDKSMAAAETVNGVGAALVVCLAPASDQGRCLRVKNKVVEEVCLQHCSVRGCCWLWLGAVRGHGGCI